MTKKEIAYLKIRDDIYSRSLHPGSKLNISELAEKYEMSAIPIREALTLLEKENLVSNTPYCGYAVSNIILGDFLEYSLIRNEMECLALRFGIAYLTDESLLHIKELQKQLSDAQRAGDERNYIQVHRQFHRSLYSFAPCVKLQEMLEDLHKRTYHAQAVMLMVPTRLQPSLNEHAKLVQYIENRDTEKATQTLFKHHLQSLISVVEKMKYDLMCPNYMEQELLCEFFSAEKLRDRTQIGGEIEYWNYIVKHLISSPPKTGN